MKCSVCGGRIGKGNRIKVKYGAICGCCSCRLPASMQANAGFYTAGQVRRLFEVIRPATSTPLISSGNFFVCKDSVIVNNVEYKLRNLKKVELNFIPEGAGISPGTVVGIITVIMETESPHFIIEEPFYPRLVTAGCEVIGQKAGYRFSYEIEKLFMSVQACLDAHAYDMTGYIKKYHTAIQIKKEFVEWMQEKNKNAERTGRKRGKPSDGMHKAEKFSPFEEAKEMYGVEMPYTASQIKKTRNILLKKHHPDNHNGSEELCRKINESYELLLKFVSA